MNRLTVIIILAAGLLAGCGKSGVKPGEARISGTFTPAVIGYLNITAGPVLDSARIDKNGEFSIDIPLASPGKAMLFFGNKLTDVFLEPGKEVILNMNSVVFPDNITFGGQLGPVNHYLTLARKLEQQSSIPASQLFSLEPEQFMRFSDSVKQLKNMLLTEYETKYKEIDPAFISRTRSDIEFSWADQRLLYPGKYVMLRGLAPALPDGYHIDYLNNLNLNNAVNLSSPAFKELIQNYLDYRESKYQDEHPENSSLIFPGSVARFRVIHEEFTDQSVKDYLLYKAMDDHLANYGTTRVESFLTDFRINCKNPEYIKNIDAIVANMEKVSLGKPAPDFTAFTPDGKKVKLSDYYGQLLYIGFWASWSGWSAQEIPYFEQLRRDFAEKPVKFILVSLDFEKDKNKWAAIISANKFQSIQLIQDPESTVLKDSYFLNDFPRYFLIGKDGKIISVYAPRPTENIAETLNRIIGSSK